MSSDTPLVISAVGDIMLGDLPACSGFGVGSMIAKYGPKFPFEKCVAGLAGSDIVIGNLEVVLSRFDPQTDSFAKTHLRAQPVAVAGLTYAGINAVTLANNHIMQHGREAVLETIRILDENAIAHTGIESAESKIKNFRLIEKKGRKVGLLGYNFRPGQYSVSPRIDVAGNLDRICSDIEAYKGQCDFLVLSLHWGEEFIGRPSPEQVQMGRKFITCGAHVILGHHPHILQGVELYRGRVIAYSLGDFVFDLWPSRLRKSMILRLELAGSDDIRFEIKPILINRNWQPVLLQGEEASRQRTEIEQLASLIDINSSMDDWNREVADELRKFRKSVYSHYLKSLHRFGPKRLFSLAKGIVTNRLTR